MRGVVDAKNIQWKEMSGAEKDLDLGLFDDDKHIYGGKHKKNHSHSHSRVALDSICNDCNVLWRCNDVDAHFAYKSKVFDIPI